ncbi:MAG: undecaprenyl/decaprenyl-phosphate alpha-N-acetylglucosaminyl 1-phosphate transferase [Chloroflexi bacterium]|nr:undecaprenyl/decaprenyl-phosphate alpha-N-acetylglucosaminyl 1-phosphate transferase [Chloroflexota bacterium]
MTPLLAFLTSAILSALGTLLAIRFGHRFGLVDMPGGRRKHGGPVPRIGGLGIFVGFFAAAAWLYFFAPLNDEHRLPLGGVLIGTVLAFVFGLVDDWKELRAGPQFVAQVVVALIAIAATVWIQEVTLPVIGFQHFPPLITYPLTILWITGMMNTVNFLDGLDGLAAGVAAIASLLFAIHMNNLGQTRIALYAVAFAGACLGFLPFNFSPARIFLGSAGAMVVGYGLATLSILAPARVATALLVMAVPIADTAWQIVNRWRSGRSPFSGDRGHLHFRLVDMGFSPRWIVVAYWSFCALFGALSLLVESRLSKLIAFVGLMAVVGGVLFVLARTVNTEQ